MAERQPEVTGGGGFDSPSGSMDIDKMYLAVLDHLLTPDHLKEKLVGSQTEKQKLQTIEMHKSIFEDDGGGSGSAGAHAKKATGSWSDRENTLLASIQKSKLPDLQSLSRLKVVLSSSNKEDMNAFLDAGGVAVLLKTLDGRVHKKPLTELDVAALYEVLACCKQVMNNSVGMDGFLSVTASIEAVARCLNFEYKAFAVLVLEILSVCCYYSEGSAMMAVHGMRLLARNQQEAPFACLVNALRYQDVEIKAAVVTFVNSMIMGIEDVNERTILRGELNCQLFWETYGKVIESVESELTAAREMQNQPDANAAVSKLRRRSMVSMYGPRAINEQKVEALIKHNKVSMNTISERGSIVAEGGVQVKSGSALMTVFPLAGTMAGLLIAAKNEKSNTGAFRSAFGGKSTKRRWYEVDVDHFGWYAGHVKEGDFKTRIHVNTITEVRPYTTDQHVLEAAPFSFEIETPDRTHALGCESQADKDNWIAALLAARDNAMMAQAAYKLQKKDLTLAEAVKWRDMFKKQGDVYYSIAVEDKRFALSRSGVDLSDPTQVSGFVRCEAVAAGHGGQLSRVLQELMLIPAGADAVWAAVARAVQATRDSAAQTKVAEAAAAGAGAKSTLTALNSKGAEGGSAYTQMSKLALALLTREQEVQHLQEEVNQLQIQNKRLALGVVAGGGEAAAGATPGAAGAAAGDAPHSVSAEDSLAAPVPPVSGETVSSSSSGGGGGGGGLLAAIRQAGGDTGDEAAPAGVAAAVAPAAVDERYEKYVKMQKMLPEGAVRQKMTTDGFSPAEIDSFFTNGPPAGAAAAGVAAAVAPAAPPDPRLAKFDKMRKMLPEGAVRQKMQQDGFSAAEIDDYFNPGSGPKTAAATAAPSAKPAPVAELPPAGMKEKPKIKPAVKMKGLFWTKIKNAEIEGTIWHKLEDYKLQPDLQKQLGDWFASKGAALDVSPTKGNGGGGSGGDKDHSKLISVLDATRTQNVLIILGKLRKTPEDLIQLVIQMDPEQLTHELTTTLIDILPSAEELAAVQAHKTCSQLDAASKVIFQFNRVPRLLQRMECHEIAFRWANDLNGTVAQMAVIISAKNEIVAAQKVLRRICAIVLAVGNTLNGDTTRGQAYGVKLDIFVKLVNLKAGNPAQGSLMNFVATICDIEGHKSKSDAELLTLSDEWVGTWAAADISLKQVQTDLNQLDLQLNKLNAEFIRIKDSAENVGLDSKLESAKGPVINPLWRRLDKFLNMAKPKMVTAKAQMKSLEQGVEDIMKQYGESLKGTSEEDSCKKFFSAIAGFAKNYRGAIDAIAAAREAEEKALKEMEAKGRKPAATGTGSSPLKASKPEDKGSNIFGAFQASQQGSADAVLAEFKNKLANRFAKANAPL